jgi:hypothetical protein
VILIDLSTLHAVALTIWAYPGVSIITLGVVLNLALAIAVALRTSTFSFRALGEFLFRQLLPYVITYFAFSLIGDAAGWGWVSTAVLVLIMAMIGAAIIEKLGQLGVPIPPGVLRLVEPPLVSVLFVPDDAGKPVAK